MELKLKQRKAIKNLREYNTGKPSWLFTNPGLSYEMPELKDDRWITPIGNPAAFNWNDINKITQEDNSPISMDKDKNALSTASKINSTASGAAAIAGGFIGQVNSVKGAQELMQDAGTQTRNIGGISYTRLNYIDESAERSAINSGGLTNTLSSAATGASAGAPFGPIGAAVGFGVGAITGLVGWGLSKNKLRKRLDNTRQLIARTNTGQQAGAMSTALQQDYYSQNNNTGGVLYT